MQGAKVRAFAPFLMRLGKIGEKIFRSGYMKLRHKNLTRKLIRQRKVSGLRITPRPVEQSNIKLKSEKTIEKYV